MAAAKGSKDGAQREGLARRASGTLSRPTSPLTVGALERALSAEFRPRTPSPGIGRDDGGRSARLVAGVAVALDPTVAAVDAAADAGANVLVTHHPAFLAPPDSFRPAPSPAASSGAAVWRAIERGVAVMSFHTALDISPQAQRVLPGMLGLAFERVLVPVSQDGGKGYGPAVPPRRRRRDDARPARRALHVGVRPPAARLGGLLARGGERGHVHGLRR